LKAAVACGGKQAHSFYLERSYMNKILEFKNQYFFLSNFYPSPITSDGYDYATVEHFFQSKKAAHSWEARMIRDLPSPSEAKRAGRICYMKGNWEDIKDSIMETALRLKFGQNTNLKASLLATGDDKLVEGNRWHDTYWGVDIETGKGQNRLGKLLMQIRDEYLNGKELR